MGTDVESFCCQESARIAEKMEEYSETTLTCVTEHPGFVANCLNSWVLDVAYLQYRHQYQHQLKFPQHE